MADWNPHANSLFIQALDLADDEREAFLESQCDGDVSLRAEVDQLLIAYRESGDFMEKPPSEFMPTLAGGNSSVSQTSDPLGFLTPSEKQGCLGTLGQYEVVSLVGRGGMGVVLRAFDPILNRVVGIKVMAPELAVNVMAVKRFIREAQAAAAVSHHHVVTIFGIDPDCRPPYIVMEFVAGQSLQDKIDQVGALSVKEILRIGSQIAEGLAAAHKQGLIHRDIKPANILLENSIERVKITDFGLARAIDDVSMTTTGQIPGTPQYMSPEQAVGENVDSRTDLFSLGSVLYTMCTGRPGFRANNAVAVLRRVVDDQPRPIREINSEIPEWLEQIVNKLLKKEPERRFGTALEVAQLLEHHLAGLQQSDSEAAGTNEQDRVANASDHEDSIELASESESSDDTKTSDGEATSASAVRRQVKPQDPQRDDARYAPVPLNPNEQVQPEWKLPPDKHTSESHRENSPADHKNEKKRSGSPHEAVDADFSSLGTSESAIRAVGIDLGTTNSMISYLDNQLKPRTISNPFGDLLTPSAVLITEEEVVVGREADRRAVMNPTSFADSFKRDMGSQYYRQEVRGQDVPPEVLSGWILSHLKSYAAKVIGPVTDVVVTVPAFFDEGRRRCTQLAAKLAGLNPIGIINEPTAAAIAFAYQRGLLESKNGLTETENLVIYDLGGGTFDVTILTAKGWSFRAIATDGDVKLGGRDFDERIVNYVAETFLDAHGVDPRSDLERCVKLWNDAEQAKHTLSSRSRAMIPVNVAGIQMNVELTRERFEEMTSDLIGRTQMSLSLVLKQAGMRWSDINRILMVGGASRMPAVTSMLYRLTGKMPEVSQSPDEVVAHGAALYAGMLVSKRPHDVLSKLELANVNSHTVGVVGRDLNTGRQIVHPLISKNAQLPASATQVFPLAEQGQRRVTAPIVEGESRQPSEAVRLGTFIIDELPPNLPAGTPVTVNFRLDEDGRLTVQAEVTGARRSARLELARRPANPSESLQDWQQRLQRPQGTSSSNISEQKSATELLDQAYLEIASVALRHDLPKKLQYEKQTIVETHERLESSRRQLLEVENRQKDAANRLEKIRAQSVVAQQQFEIRQLQQQYHTLLLHLGRKCYDERVQLPDMAPKYDQCQRLRKQV